MILATGPKARARGGRAAAAVTARALAVASRVRSLAALASRAHLALCLFIFCDAFPVTYPVPTEHRLQTYRCNLADISRPSSCRSWCALVLIRYGFVITVFAPLLSQYLHDSCSCTKCLCERDRFCVWWPLCYIRGRMWSQIIFSKWVGTILYENFSFGSSVQYIFSIWYNLMMWPIFVTILQVS